LESRGFPADVFCCIEFAVPKTGASSKLEPRERFVLDAVSGWLMLGNTREALAELEGISRERRGHPEVLIAEWEALAQAREWPRALEVATQLSVRAPERCEGFIKRAYALHELRRTQEAWDCLLPASTRFFDQWIIPYNLACYACQMGSQTDALKWLRRALKLGEKEQLVDMALADPDLEPIRSKLAELKTTPS